MGLEEGAEVLGVVDTSLLQIHVEGRQREEQRAPTVRQLLPNHPVAASRCCQAGKNRFPGMEERIKPGAAIQDNPPKPAAPLSPHRGQHEVTKGTPRGCCGPAEGEACRCLGLQEGLGLLLILLHSCPGRATL